MTAPAKIRITKLGFELYTGHLGAVHFTNGVSDDDVSDHLINRIASAIQCVRVDADGGEVPAGAAVALMDTLTPRASEVEALSRQTEDDRTREQRAITLKGEVAPVENFYTRDELLKVADDGGIKPLRKIAEPWGVKGRAIPELIREILEAQATYVRDRDLRRAAVGLKTEAEELAEKTVTDQVETVETVGTPSDDADAENLRLATGASLVDAINAGVSAAVKAENDGVIIQSTDTVETPEGDVVTEAPKVYTPAPLDTKEGVDGKITHEGTVSTIPENGDTKETREGEVIVETPAPAPVLVEDGLTPEQIATAQAEENRGKENDASKEAE